jgi:hypothetical protein
MIGIRKKNTDKKGSKKTSKDEVRIIMIERLDGNVGIIKSNFMADKKKDEDSKMTRIINESNSFNEYMPSADQDVICELKDDEITTKIKKLNNTLKLNNGKPNPKINETDIKLDITKLTINKQLNKFRNKKGELGTFQMLSQDGEITIFYLHENDELIPLRINLDAKTIHTDCGSKRKPAAIAFANTLNKFQSKLQKAIEGRAMFFLTILLIWTAVCCAGTGLVLWKYHQYDSMYENSKIAEIQQASADTTFQCLNQLTMERFGLNNESESDIFDKKHPELTEKTDPVGK